MQRINADLEQFSRHELSMIEQKFLTQLQQQFVLKSQTTNPRFIRCIRENPRPPLSQEPKS